jgi:oligopeptide/dipeptide ABC transporter ATP-binding protein
MTILAAAGIQRLFRSGDKVIRAVDGVDLAVASREVVGLVGESGCGKTTLARVMVGLDRPTDGQVTLDGQRLVRADGSVERSLRHRVQLVFQDPHASFDPRRTVGRSVGLPLRVGGMSGRQTGVRVAELLEDVGLDPRLADRHPHTLSGGQLQRAAIARALAPEPDILVCDEPVASMDVSVRAQILNLLLDLRRARGIGVLFVSHDLGVVRRIADRVAVMYLGRIVETGGSETVWRLPRHPYTRSLAASVPTGSTTWRHGMSGTRLEGEPPSPVDVPPGCRFHPRCPIAIERCQVDDPQLRSFPPDVEVACHLAELAGQPSPPTS